MVSHSISDIMFSANIYNMTFGNTTVKCIHLVVIAHDYKYNHVRCINYVSMSICE